MVYFVCSVLHVVLGILRLVRGTRCCFKGQGSRTVCVDLRLCERMVGGDEDGGGRGTWGG